MAEIKCLEDMRTFLGATDYSAVVVMHSADRGPTERMATDERLDKLRQKLEEDVARLAEEKLEAIGLICSLDDSRMQMLLWEYYIRTAKNWEAAADAIGYSRQHATKLHGQALQLLRLNASNNI